MIQNPAYEKWLAEFQKLRNRLPLPQEVYEILTKNPHWLFGKNTMEEIIAKYPPFLRKVETSDPLYFKMDAMRAMAEASIVASQEKQEQAEWWAEKWNESQREIKALKEENAKQTQMMKLYRDEDQKMMTIMEIMKENQQLKQLNKQQ